MTRKINFVKIGWGSLIIGTMCFIILLGIAYDTYLNKREEFPWFTIHLIILIIISGILGIIFSTNLLMKGKRRKRF